MAKRAKRIIAIAAVAALALSAAGALGACGGGAGTGAAATTQAAATSAAPAGTTAQGAGQAAGAESGGGAADGGESGMNPSGVFPLVQEQETFSIMMPPMGTANPDTCWTDEEYEKMTNVHIEWITVPWDGWQDKRSIVFASGDLPDAIAGMDTTNLSATEELMYASQGLLLPLNELLEENSVYFLQRLDEYPMTRKLISQDNGEIYSFPYISICFHCNYSQKMFINSQWLENVGLAMPTTTDEFHAALKAFKEQDANGNGDPNDEIPLMAASSGWHADIDGFLMNAFTYYEPESRFAVEDGHIEFTPVTDGYREGLRYLNTLYAEGLISPEAFTNTADMNQTLNVANYPHAAIGAYATAYQNFNGDTDIWMQYDIMPPLKGPSGLVTTPDYSLTRDVIRGNFAITNKAKNPALIVRWLDWFYSDEGVLFRRGREGIEWRKAEPGELDFNGNQADIATLKTPEDDPYYNNVDWSQTIPSINTKEHRESVVAGQDWRDPDISNGTEIQLFKQTIPYAEVARSVDISLPRLTVPEGQISDYSRIETEITDYCKEALVKFITGDLSLDSDWDAYKAQLDKYQLQEYVKMSDDAYQSFLSR
jgi:putative aldouronate transport system substrate-binding protein